MHCNIASEYGARNVKRNPESPGVCCWFFRVVGDWGVWAARRPARRRRGASFRSYASLVPLRADPVTAEGGCNCRSS